MREQMCHGCGKVTPHKLFLEGGKDFEYGVPGEFKQIKCEGCGVVAMDPMPALNEILTFYPSDYHGYGEPASRLTKWLIERNLRQRAKMYKKRIGSKASILDVGAADGAHFSVWNEEPDWQLYGLEFNNEAAAKGRNAGWDIQTSTIETYDSKGKKFDLIIMNHLLEHVQNPRAVLRHAYDLLKPGGWIIGEVPSLKSWDFAIFGKYWGGCHWPRHLHQFTPESLTKTFEGAGFRNTHISYLLHTSHWALSVQNRLQDPAFATKLDRGRSWYYSLLLLAFIPVNAVQILLSRTGIIGFRTQKPL